MPNRRPVIVKQLPARLGREQAQALISQLDTVLRSNQPRIVFDLSQVRRMDSAGVDMLLKCLQEVMRRDGDLKLAAVSSESAIVLELTRVDRLFEIFETTADAVESFFTFPVRTVGYGPGQGRISTIPATAGLEMEDFKAAS